MARHADLVADFVQEAAAGADLAPAVLAGNHEDRDRIPVGLAHRGQDIGDAGAGDREADAEAAGHPGVAVGHEPEALLVATRDVPDARGR